ncbi:MAG: acyl carrier protein [Alphaproteobacteria bacterium]|nr:acyl carrier protein [Alphaproteobacteria bacterium]
MNRETVSGIVKDIICEQMGCDLDNVMDCTSLAGDLGADSLDLVEIYYKLEARFDINIDIEESLETITVYKIIDAVVSKL